MKLGGIDFPSALMTALRDHRLVVFAGAGVSMGKPASLPDFRTLAKQIAQDTGEDIAGGEPEDRFLGRLQTDRGVQVHARAAALLAQSCPRATDLHCDLLRLFPVTTSTRIVTTNFDLLFEQAAEEGTAASKLEVFRAPALPLGREFDGIVHVHGAIDRPDTTVLTDADFGRAYLTDGWARRFLLDLFQSFTILFVGYSHDDIVMHYLARALPVGDTQRFVLTDKFGDGRWTRLGVVPIPFPNYGTLYSGIRELAKYRSRGILDWQHEIREIANSDPPTGAYETETLAEAFSDPARTRFFTTSARDPAWIDWLDRHRRLINLLRGQDPLTEPERELARWLAKAFAWNHPDELWRIIGRHRMRLHPEFWRLLAHEVGLRDSNVTDAKILSRWVSVLLATASHASDTELQYLAERCVKHGDVDGLIAVFEHVTTVTLRFSRFFTGLHGDAESRSVPTVLAELDVANADYPHTAAYVWKNGLQPKLGQIAGRLLTYVVSNLKTQHRTRSTWGAASRNWDPLSMSRFAIEVGERTPHTQIPDISDVLIDSARDCLEWLATSEPVGAAHWCDQLASAPAPILRRLAIHGVIARDRPPPPSRSCRPSVGPEH